MKKIQLLFVCLIFVISGLNVDAQDLWQQLNGPFGGYVNKLLSSPSGALYAISSSGVYKSINEGGSWIQVTPSSIKNITCGCIAPNGFIYIGTGGSAPKIYRSTDEGSSWILRFDNVLHEFCDMTVTPGGTVFAGTAYRFSFHTQFIQSGEIFRSIDNGNTFSLTPFPDLAVGAISANTNGDVYATCTNGLLRSVNSGASWSVLRNDTCSKVFTNNSGNIFFSTRQGVLRSTNNGGSWSSIPKFPMASGSGGILFTAEGGTLFKTTDNGDTWNLISAISSSSSFNTNSLLLSGTSIVYAGSNFGVFKSDNSGNNWAEANIGIRISNISSVVSKGTNIFAGSELYISRSTDNGNSWINLVNGLPVGGGRRLLKISPNSSIFAYIYGAGIYRSVNNGDAWTQLSNLPAGLSEGTMVFSSSSEIFATAIDKIYKSVNNGDNWTVISSGLPADTTIDIYGISIDNENNLYATLSTGLGILEHSLFKSTNGGANWSQISNQRAPGELKFDTQGQIWGIVTTGLKRSTNGGANFQSVSSVPSFVINLEIGSQNQIFIQYVENEIYGIKRSTNNGGSWEEYNQGLGQLLVYDMEFDENNRLLAGTQSGLFRTLGATVGISQNSGTAREFSLSQNYPNPFNPQTTISFSLPSSGFVKLAVYNSIGEQVELLVHQNMDKGEYAHEWNGTGFASGIYFYKLEAESFTSVKKMILVK